MSGTHAGPAANPFKQPRAVFAVAFACVVSFMGIGLVDPILPAISHQLHASPSEVTLLFTSYLVVTAVAMLITNWVSSRLGAKPTLIAGLALIVIFSALAGASPSIGGIIGFRAGWGVGNALFIATSLAVIVASASGGFAGAIVLYETALGIGIAIGPLLGGTLGQISWRGPFFGVAALMAIALIATVVLVERTPRPARKTSLSAPLRALRHRGLLTMSLTALCYNWGFFTVLGYAPFPMNLTPIKLGLVFFGWGILVAIFAVFGAPRLQERFGIARTMYANLAAFAVVVLVIAIWTTDRAVLIPAVIASGIFIGVNNTITTQAVMTVSPVERPVASAAYSFVRFIGGGLAPYAAGRLVVALNIHVPFFIAAAALAAGILILSTARRLLTEAEQVQAEQVSSTAGTPPAPALVPVGGNAARGSRPAAGVILAAIDDSPVAGLVTEAAATLAAAGDRIVHVVHAQEGATASDVGTDAEDLGTARTAVRNHLEWLAARHIPAEGQILLHASGHGAAGRLIADYAGTIGATTIVIGAPTHGGLPALMDASASRELWRHAASNILIINPAAGAGSSEPGTPALPGVDARGASGRAARHARAAAECPVAGNGALAGGGRLRGTVRSAAGESAPLPGANVILSDLAGNVIASTVTGRDGGFTVGAPSAGRYAITATAPGHLPASRRIELNGHAETAHLALPPEREVHGIVRSPGGEPVPGIIVTAAGETFASATTDSRGRYRLTGLGDGGYLLIAGGHEPASAGVEVESGETASVTIRISASPGQAAGPEPGEPGPAAAGTGWELWTA
jgi:MFS transporter, ACDE family, multidrug resistance protein